MKKNKNYDTRRNTKRKRPPFERPLCKIALYCNIKPYLRSMSSMTDKEKKDLLNYVVGKGSKYFEVCDDVSIMDKSSDVQDLKSFELKWINFNPNTTSRYIEWLLKNHFDFCDLIPKNLALPAPEGMYKI